MVNTPCFNNILLFSVQTIKVRKVRGVWIKQMIDGCIIILIRYQMQLKLQLLNDSVFVTLIKGDVNLRLPYI